MTKLSIDISKLNSDAIPNLKLALAGINESIYDTNILEIPYDFKYASYLKNLKQANIESRNKISNSIKLIETSILDYNKLEISNSSKISKIKIEDAKSFRK